MCCKHRLLNKVEVRWLSVNYTSAHMTINLILVLTHRCTDNSENVYIGVMSYRYDKDISLDPTNSISEYIHLYIHTYIHIYTFIGFMETLAVTLWCRRALK